MQLSTDLALVAKKIIVGLAVAFIPLLIIGGGLWLARTLLTHG